MQQLNQSYQNKNVLITGGAGFIGSHLAEKCYELGARVTILDNFSTGQFKNIAHISSDITCIEGDIRDAAVCHRAACNTDIIFHLAAATSVPESIEKPCYYYATNIQGTLNMLNAAATMLTQRFIFASSAAVYGNYEGICSETTLCNPQSPYGFSKYIGEKLCDQFSTFHHVSTISLRYFNVYGTRQRGDLPHAGVIAHFQHCLTTNTPFTLYGSGQQQRDFVSVADVVTANLIFGAYTSQAFHSETYNIGSGRTATVQQMLDAVLEEHPEHVSSLIRYAPARRGDVAYSAADCSKYNRFKEHISY